MKRKLLQFKSLLFILIILLLGFPLRAVADEGVSEKTQDSDRLRFDLYIYAWAAGIDGDVSVLDQTAHTSVQFGDILHNLKMGANGAFKISKGDWFLLNDTIYMDVSHKSSFGAPPGGFPVDISLDNKVLTDLMVAGHQWQSPISWSLFAGARYFYGRVRIDAIVSPGFLNQETVAIKSKQWVTPTVGGEVNFPFNNKLSFNFIADIGAASKSFNWEAMPLFSWKFNTTFTAVAGYRLLDVRYKDDDFKIDTLMHGPIVGMKVSF